MLVEFLVCCADCTTTMIFKKVCARIRNYINFKKPHTLLIKERNPSPPQLE